MFDSPLRITLWPNPVYRNQREDQKWFFNASLQEGKGRGVQIQRYRAEWIADNGRLYDFLEDSLDIFLSPFEQVNFPDLWVSSNLLTFTYRLVLFGVDATGEAFSVCGELLCHSLV
jgi:hypothetical protein